jgi:hypothetical protein|tara:strand:+ start:210 stop:467 length:258 start_codon:yes stop_codon:yes gene_type:complete
MKIVQNKNGSITATVSIPKELEEAIEEEANTYRDAVDLNEIFAESEITLIEGALNNFFPKLKGLPDEIQRTEELEELIQFIGESC